MTLSSSSGSWTVIRKWITAALSPDWLSSVQSGHLKLFWNSLSWIISSMPPSLFSNTFYLNYILFKSSWKTVCPKQDVKHGVIISICPVWTLFTSHGIKLDQTDTSLLLIYKLRWLILIKMFRTTCLIDTHLVVESLLHHQSVSLQVEQIFRVHCDRQSHIIHRADLHQLDVRRVVLRDRHRARRNRAHWERREAAGQSDRFWNIQDLQDGYELKWERFTTSWLVFKGTVEVKPVVSEC